MRTLIVSDLHLGSLHGADLLRRPALRAPLLGAAADVDRLVLLGDVLELRHGPLREAMDAARPFFEDLGEALAGRELVIVAGNHDHALVEPWLARRGEESEPAPLQIEQLLDPEQVSPAYERIAGWASRARVRVAYPGLWVRADAYATHGHYLDSHLTVPTLERLSVAAMGRLLRKPDDAMSCVSDYEAVGAPVFAWRDAVARDAHTGSALNGIATVGAWRALNRGGGGAGADGQVQAGSRPGPRARGVRALHQLRRRAFVAAFPLAVAALNRAGLGPLSSDVSGTELRRAGLRAMDEVAVRLGLGDAYVIFGHTHRAGPLRGDDEREWRGRGGARLLNTGSWTYAAIFVGDTPGESPYWPGAGVLVEESGPPVVVRMLQDRTRTDIRPIRA
jgi:Calcineurin-like phosphoesterase